MSDDIHSVGDNQKPPTEQSASGQEGEKEVPHLASVPMKTPTDTEYSECKQSGSCHKLKDWIEWVFKILEAVAFIAIIFTFFEMRHTRMDDDRAWVVPFEVAAVSIPETNLMFFQILYKNTGKSPAIDVHSLICADWKLESIPKMDSPPQYPHTSMLLGPEGVANVNTGREPATDVIINTIKKGVPYYIYGTIWYDDIFGRHHWSQFSYLVGSNLRAFQPTAIHNSCDN